MKKEIKILLGIIAFALVVYLLIRVDTANAEETEVSYIVLIEYENSVYKEETRDFRVEKLIVTAYAPLDNRSGICADGDPTVTSTGTYPERGTVAVNPQIFAYGTEFYIDGYGYGKALDTGGAIRRVDNKIDVVVDTYEEAMKWGVKEVWVVLYE